MRRRPFPDDFGDEQLVARRDESFARAERYREEIRTMSSVTPTTEHIMQFFAYEHLPPHLQAVSRPFCELARALVQPGGGVQDAPLVPRNPERTVALRKLLEAKDAAVRAVLAKDPT